MQITWRTYLPWFGVSVSLFRCYYRRLFQSCDRDDISGKVERSCLGFDSVFDRGIQFIHHYVALCSTETLKAEIYTRSSFLLAGINLLNLFAPTHASTFTSPNCALIHYGTIYASSGCFEFLRNTSIVEYIDILCQFSPFCRVTDADIEVV